MSDNNSKPISYDTLREALAAIAEQETKQGQVTQREARPAASAKLGRVSTS